MSLCSLWQTRGRREAETRRGGKEKERNRGGSTLSSGGREEETAGTGVSRLLKIVTVSLNFL